MADWEAQRQEGQLILAAKCGDAAHLNELLQAGVDANARATPRSDTALCEACSAGHPECVELLLAAGADHSLTRKESSHTALHLAAWNFNRISAARRAACVAALLRAGADPFAVGHYGTPLHAAVHEGNLKAVRLMCEAAYAWECHGSCERLQYAYIARDAQGSSPLRAALRLQHKEIAHYMVAEAPWSPRHAGSVLAVLSAEGDLARSLYPALVARCPLTPEQWAQVPVACPCLGTALPAVLRRSEAEAALLVRHLPSREQQCLRTLALSLGAAQRRGQLPSLPLPIVNGLLAEGTAHYAVVWPNQQHAQQSRQRLQRQARHQEQQQQQQQQQQTAQHQKQGRGQQQQQRPQQLGGLQMFGLLLGAPLAAMAASVLLLRVLKGPAVEARRREAAKSRKLSRPDGLA